MLAGPGILECWSRGDPAATAIEPGRLPGTATLDRLRVLAVRICSDTFLRLLAELNATSLSVPSEPLVW